MIKIDIVSPWEAIKRSQRSSTVGLCDAAYKRSHKTQTNIVLTVQQRLKRAAYLAAVCWREFRWNRNFAGERLKLWKTLQRLNNYTSNNFRSSCYLKCVQMFSAITLLTVLLGYLALMLFYIMWNSSRWFYAMHACSLILHSVFCVFLWVFHSVFCATLMLSVLDYLFVLFYLHFWKSLFARLKADSEKNLTAKTSRVYTTWEQYYKSTVWTSYQWILIIIFLTHWHHNKLGNWK